MGNRNIGFIQVKCINKNGMILNLPLSPRGIFNMPLQSGKPTPPLEKEGRRDF
ncbi:MAG: hypothetical protein QG588_591, partial [Candidatus Poribacteria bacterium]|nr:hypothetical protein [Candidatus Poribacteria bacterium]